MEGLACVLGVMGRRLRIDRHPADRVEHLVRRVGVTGGMIVPGMGAVIVDVWLSHARLPAHHTPMGHANEAQIYPMGAYCNYPAGV